MKNIKLKIFTGVTAFLLGIGAAAFVYRSIPEKINKIEEQAIETRLPENFEQDAVYAVILNELLIKDRIKQPVISDQTSFVRNFEYADESSVEKIFQDMKKSYEEAEDETLKDFNTKNRQSSKLNFNFEFPVQYRFINKEKLGKGSDNEISNIHNNLRADGLIEFSGVGFNHEKTQALVLVDYIYCPQCGFGKSILLKKVDGHWKIIKAYENWIS